VNADQRGELAANLLPYAAGLACIVQGDGDATDVAHLLNQMNYQEQIALIVVLAGLVDTSRSLVDALSWLTWDKDGNPLPETRRSRSKGTVADIAKFEQKPNDNHALLLHEQKVMARCMNRRPDVSHTNIAEHFGIDERTVGRWIHESEAAA
jgi:hypothetical protein